ncbi:hypothetical protein B0H14DRAFT_2588831 [Mycena olivaceomarginata]|nr:hypothetical protein B0H14DRAFT_2588831 [Mycena olivaceomarginata]
MAQPRVERALCLIPKDATFPQYAVCRGCVSRRNTTPGAEVDQEDGRGLTWKKVSPQCHMAQTESNGLPLNYIPQELADGVWHVPRKSTPERGRGKRAHQTHPDRTAFSSPVAHRPSPSPESRTGLFPTYPLIWAATVERCAPRRWALSEQTLQLPRKAGAVRDGSRRTGRRPAAKEEGKKTPVNLVWPSPESNGLPLNLSRENAARVRPAPLGRIQAHSAPGKLEGGTETPPPCLPRSIRVEAAGTSGCTARILPSGGTEEAGLKETARHRHGHGHRHAKNQPPRRWSNTESDGPALPNRARAAFLGYAGHVPTYLVGKQEGTYSPRTPPYAKPTSQDEFKGERNADPKKREKKNQSPHTARPSPESNGLPAEFLPHRFTQCRTQNARKEGTRGIRGEATAAEKNLCAHSSWPSAESNGLPYEVASVYPTALGAAKRPQPQILRR